jgi:hypothetical protein
MAEKAPQTYANHRRWVPMYHYVISGLLLVNVIYAVSRIIAAFSLQSTVYLLTAVAIVLLSLYARGFAVMVQDRVIRLEERLRLEQLLPETLKPRIQEFTVPQLVGLRFASDGELPALAQKVLDENIQNREEIKKQIKEWRADYCRC